MIIPVQIFLPGYQAMWHTGMHSRRDMLAAITHLTSTRHAILHAPHSTPNVAHSVSARKRVIWVHKHLTYLSHPRASCYFGHKRSKVSNLRTTKASLFAKTWWLHAHSFSINNEASTRVKKISAKFTSTIYVGTCALLAGWQHRIVDICNQISCVHRTKWWMHRENLPSSLPQVCQ